MSTTNSKKRRYADLTSSEDAPTHTVLVPVRINEYDQDDRDSTLMIQIPWLCRIKVNKIFKELRRFISSLPDHALTCSRFSPYLSHRKVRITRVSGFVHGSKINSIGRTPITDFSKDEIESKGLTVSLEVEYPSGCKIEEQSKLNSTKLAQSAIAIPQTQQKIVKICVKLNGICNKGFVIYSLYSEKETFKNVINAATTWLQHQLYQKYQCMTNLKMIDATFCDNDRRKPKCSYAPLAWEHSLLDKMDTPITTFNAIDFLRLTLHIHFGIEYEHKVQNVDITCEHMIKTNTNDPMGCPIYCAVKQKYEFNEANYHHLRDCNHWKNEFKEKPQCRYSAKCKAFIRQQNGEDHIDDKCHMVIYRHPPRTRNIELARNLHSFIFNKLKIDNQPLYKPDQEDKEQFEYNAKDGFLEALIAEVKDNKFAYDLCLECGDSDECKHSEHSILKIVDEKMNHTRHKQIRLPLRRDEMLALILYTGCDCNYDLCEQQRNGNYIKWKWFDYCLFGAIRKLSHKESGEFVVYSGLNGVKMNKKSVRSGYFVTYTSTTWEKDIAKAFMKGDGMIVSIDKKFKNDRAIKCCDVSWISKFPDECEVLFARSLEYKTLETGFVCNVMDAAKGVQMICLKKMMQREQ
eukprot:31934_1